MRNHGSTIAYDKVANITYTIATPPCATPSLSGNPSGSAASGSTPVLTASTSGCPTPNYRFWVGQNGMWTMKEDYSATNTFSWDTSGLRAGTYGIEVDVRDASSSAAYDHVANLTYALSGCTAASLGASPSASAAAGTTVVLTATAACPGTSTYRFLVNGVVVQDYGTTNTFSWNTTGKATGSYQLEVDVRDQGAGGYQAWSIIAYRLA